MHNEHEEVAGFRKYPIGVQARTHVVKLRIHPVWHSKQVNGDVIEHNLQYEAPHCTHEGGVVVFVAIQL